MAHAARESHKQNAGYFSRLPYELRQSIWDYLQDDTMLRVNAQLRNEIMSNLDLTIEIPSAPYSVTGRKKETHPWMWPTQIYAYHQLQEFTLFPAYFDFCTPERESLDRFLFYPINLYRSITLSIDSANSMDVEDPVIRIYNSLSWTLELLQEAASNRLPRTHVVFSGKKSALTWTVNQYMNGYRYCFRTPKSLRSRFDVGSGDYGVPKGPYFSMCLRLLYKLRNAAQMKISYSKNLARWDDLSKIEARVEEIQLLSVSGLKFGEGEDDPRIEADINLEAAFIELCTSAPSDSWLSFEEKRAFWSDSYENAARRRLELAKNPDGTVPEFIEEARHLLGEDRQMICLDNPLGVPFRVLYGDLIQAVRYQERLREEVGAEPGALWSPGACLAHFTRAFPWPKPRPKDSWYLKTVPKLEQFLAKEDEEKAPWRYGWVAYTIRP